MPFVLIVSGPMLLRSSISQEETVPYIWAHIDNIGASVREVNI